MKCKVVRHRITIPTEIRNAANIQDGEYLDIEYDEDNNMIKIMLNSKLSVDTKSDRIENKQKPKKRAAATNKKIEANFMDASKLYHQCFSECGLLVRTKNSYVKNACEKCRGKLAEEWSDRAEVHCSYLGKDLNNRVIDIITERVHPEITEIKQQRDKAKKDIKNLSNNIKKAIPCIEVEIKEAKKKSKITVGRVKVNKNEKSKNSKLKHKETAIIQPVSYADETVKCSVCGLFYSKGFKIDGDFLCKSCAIEDFKIFLKDYRKENGEK